MLETDVEEMDVDNSSLCPGLQIIVQHMVLREPEGLIPFRLL